VPYLRPVLNDSDRFARNSAVELMEEMGFANRAFDGFVSSVREAGAAEGLMDLVRSEGYNWFNARLNEVDAETRRSVLSLVGAGVVAKAAV